jgi:KAP family P-loop domain
MTPHGRRFSGLERFKISETIGSTLEIATLYATSGILGVEEFFRAAVSSGRDQGATSAAFLYAILLESAGTDALIAAFPLPARTSVADAIEVHVVLEETFQYSASIRSRTGGQDDFLGLRHILFSLLTLPRTVPLLNRLLRPINLDAARLASRFTEFLRDSLETGEHWEEWLRIIHEQTGSTPALADQTAPATKPMPPEGSSNPPPFDETIIRKETSRATAEPSSSNAAEIESRAAIQFNIDQTPLSDGATYILKSAAHRASSRGVISTTLVLIELIERGKARGGAYWSADFLRQEVNPLTAKYIEMRNEYLGSETRSGSDEGVLDFVTPGLAYALTRAQEVAEQTSGDRTIFARHLLASIIVEAPAPRRLGSTSRLNKLGVDLLLLREHLFAWLKGYGDNDDAWRLFLLGSNVPPQRLTQFDADDTRGPDLLDVQRDVRALATLIASRLLAPPLSVGIFGDWGTGKTFFMRQLQRMVAQLSADARGSGRPQCQVPFYKHIIQIEFNAWHYVEGNLWASLVEHIFRNLRQTDRSTRASVEAIQKHWIEQLGFKETALAQATERVKAAASQIDSANQKVEDLRKEHQAKTKELQRLSAKNVARDFNLGGVPKLVAEALLPLGLQPASDAATDLDSSLREARGILERGNTVLTPLFRSVDRKARWLSLFLILFSGPATVFLVNFILHKSGKGAISQISSFMTWATTTLTLGAGWIRKQGAWMSARLDELEKANRSYDAALRNQEAEIAKEIAQTEQELALARQEYSAAQQVAEQARRDHEAVQKELAEATPGRLLGKFIDDRAASSDYRKHLGVLAVIRDDFEEMSKLIEQENERLSKLTSLAEERSNEDKRVNRIVLYIDDLDRCPPNKVIEVLQAVHLLLAFPLFVVVVGVDARWIARSLETRYRELLRVDGSDPAVHVDDLFGAARSDDYLEKIFQIPLWLRPLDASGVRRMIQGLLRTDLGSVVADGPAGNRQAEIRVSVQPGLGQPVTGTTSTPPGEQTAAITALSNPAVESDSKVGPETTVESLEVRDFEMNAIDELSPLLGRSPRALKRFVNVYRLIKAGLTPAELGSFVKSNPNGLSPYEAVLLLLAVDTGLPYVSRALFDFLRREAAQLEVPEAQEPIENGVSRVIDALEGSMAASREWLKLKAWLKAREQSTILANAVPVLMTWAPIVSRYSFQAAHAE